MIELWTDGSAGPTNPGPGGWAVVCRSGVVRVGSEDRTTNIRMEGQAILEAMRYAAGRRVIIRSDSQFWISTLTEWAPSWERNNWRKSNGDEPANLDMIRTSLWVYRAAEQVTKFIWVKGHNGDQGNEFADQWATRARLQKLRY
jgi:ribonuclease HI